MIKFFIVGTPYLLKGLVSTIVPLPLIVVQLMGSKLFLIILSTIYEASSLPVNPNPNGVVEPKSLSKAKTWFFISSIFCLIYYQAPEFSPPYSSPDQPINLKVLLGYNPKILIALNASKQVINPPPSSLAPV